MTLVPNCPSLPLWIKSKTIKQKVLISKNNSSILGDSFLTYYSWKEINSRWLPHPLYKTYCCSLSPNQNGPLTSFLMPSTLNKGLFFVLTDILPHNTRKDRKLYPIPSLTLVIWIVLFFLDPGGFPPSSPGQLPHKNTQMHMGMSVFFKLAEEHLWTGCGKREGSIIFCYCKQRNLVRKETLRTEKMIPVELPAYRSLKSTALACLEHVTEKEVTMSSLLLNSRFIPTNTAPTGIIRQHIWI